MPDKRSHRGPHPQDARLFATAAIEDLQNALADFSMLLTKGYADKSTLKLVGDKFSLTQRQRLAIMRSACSDQQLDLRKQRQVKVAGLAHKPLVIDGYNVLITVEAAMSDAVVFKGRDGCCRDLAGIHGTYRKVTETIPAIELIGEFLKDKSVSQSLWLLDSPVSNSGRLKKLIGELAQKKGWKLDVELLPSPDAELIRTDNIIVSSDSVVLDGCKKWVNLAGAIIEEKLPDTWLLDLS
ncbi:MAG: DUF434 domain-containing protein [Sedimentisphaerales bacterium]|nr:DUF434 domain-containing protein [Sedimentisphaerales bacterium]